jgi:hypothetical protein
MDDSIRDETFSATKRKMNRDSLLLKAVLRFSNAQEEHEVRIRNLSAGELMAEVPNGLSRGERIDVKIQNIGWVGGHVAWAIDGRIGVAFDKVINPKDARIPVRVSELDVPPYLKKLNEKTAPGKLRRV